MAGIRCQFYPSSADLQNNALIEYLSQVTGQAQEALTAVMRGNSEMTVPFPRRRDGLEFVRRVAELGGFACYGPMDDNYRLKFERYREGFRLSWGWLPFLFQNFWYLFKGLWQKAIFYLVIVTLLMEVPLVGLFITPFCFIYFGTIGRYDYYLKKCRGEILWPKLPYHKLKWPFWIFTLAVAAFYIYNAGRAYFSFKEGARYMFEEQHRAQTGEPFTGNGFRFDAVSPEWFTLRYPPERFNLSVTRTTDSGSERLTLGPYKDLVMIAGIQDAGEAVPEKGLIGVAVKERGGGKIYRDLKNPDLIETARKLTGFYQIPFYFKWFNLVDHEAGPLNEYELNGRAWAHQGGRFGLNLFGFQTNFYGDAYWTIVNGKAVYAVSHAFESTLVDMHRHMRRFVESFSAEDEFPPPAREKIPEPLPEKNTVVKKTAPKMSVQDPQTALTGGKSYSMVLKSGKTVEGKVVSKDAQGFWLEVEAGARIYLNYRDVDSLIDS